MSDTAKTIAFVRTEEAPSLPPPASEVGIGGWLKRNVFASMTNFGSVGASIQSILMIVMTFFLLYVGITGLWKLFDISIFSAIWSDPTEQKRLACATVQQNGELPADWYGACWPFISAKWKYMTYGPYPEAALWRPNLVFLGLAVGIAWLVREAIPARRTVGIVLIVAAVALGLFYQSFFGDPIYSRVGVWLLAAVGAIFTLAPDEGGNRAVAGFMLLVFPVIAFVLLSGGNLDIAPEAVGITAVFGGALAGLGAVAGRGLLGTAGQALGGTVQIVGYGILAVGVLMGVASIDFGMVSVPTADWGGLLVTLVVALVGIVASLPIGIALALGRRSSLPVIRILSIVFIEFWRGVPLVTVLFMSSVMLPLFLPSGVEFDKLLRALIGVALFSAAYMAEVVRGGLQAIPKGQYEGAMAMGLPYWKMMNLIVLPQALVLVIPGIVNTFIGLFKDTTLVLIIGLFDLLGGTRQTFTDAAWATPVQSITGFIIVAFIFFLFCFGMSRYSMWMEGQLRRGHAR